MAISQVEASEYPRDSLIVDHFAKFLVEHYASEKENVVQFNFHDDDWAAKYEETNASIYDMQLARDWVAVHGDLGVVRIHLIIDPTRKS